MLTTHRQLDNFTIRGRQFIPDFAAMEETEDVVTTTTGEAPPAADSAGFGRILLAVDGTPCVIIFISVTK